MYKVCSLKRTLICLLFNSSIFCMQDSSAQEIHRWLEEKLIANSAINVTQALGLYESLAIKTKNLAYECAQAECPVKNPHLQAGYKNETLLMLSAIAHNNDGLVNWTIFASGGLKPEFDILHQFFALYPTARVWIECIDIDYLFLVDRLEDAKHYDYFCSINNKAFSIEKNHQYSNDADIKFQYLKAINFLYIINRCIEDIARHYPKASLYIKPFYSAEQYIESCEKKDLSFADLISGTDFTDTDSIAEGSLQDYQELISYVQKNNPSVRNIALIALLHPNNTFSPSLIEIPHN